MNEPRYSRSRDSRTGTVYVYQVIENYWDSEKQQARNKRILIGKVHPETGEIIPTGPRGRPPKNQLERESETEVEDYKTLYLKARKTLVVLEEQRKSAQEQLDQLLCSHEETLAQVNSLQAKVKEETELIKRLRRNL